jgi:hypothetical protein
MLLAKALTAATALAFASASMAQDSAALARTSQTSWVAFQCTALASINQDKAETARLFKFGYSQGQTFFTGLRDGKIKESDVNQYTPTVVLWIAGGAPSIDFALGRLSQVAQDDALKGVYGDPNKSDEVERAAAARKFDTMNCSAIGIGTGQ